MFPRFKNDRIYALDLDGVIIDSIDECFKVASITYLSDSDGINGMRELFHKYRGLVGPAYEYYYLMIAINKFDDSDEFNIQDHFISLKREGRSDQAQKFEKDFFNNRRKLQKSNFDKWIQLNPLTQFGQYIQKNDPKNIIIITTKNKDSAK